MWVCPVRLSVRVCCMYVFVFQCVCCVSVRVLFQCVLCVGMCCMSEDCEYVYRLCVSVGCVRVWVNVVCRVVCMCVI